MTARLWKDRGADSRQGGDCFRGMGYRFAGKLTNNTHIGGGVESMGVWYKYMG